ncbi:MAG: hypothetical protein AB7V26_13865 [Lysobacterales bacterium]
MIELLLGLLIKFWMFLFGILRGTVSAVPVLRRLRLRSGVDSTLEPGRLVLSVERRDLLLVGLRVLARDTTGIDPVFNGDLVLVAGQSQVIPLPADCLGCVLIGELIDLGNGRRAHLFRRLGATAQSGLSD